MKTMFLILFGQTLGLIKFADGDPDPIRMRLYDVVARNLTHKWYKRTVEKASLYEKLITGEGMDTLLRMFTKRETEPLFNQRKEITQHIIQAVCKNLMDVSYKLPRSTSKIRVLTYSGETPEDKAKNLEAILREFWGDQSLDDWFATRFIELNYMDPNTFVVTEFGGFDENKEHAKPYPFEVSSAMAVDYQYVNNVLDYLIVKQSIVLNVDNQEITEEEIKGKPATKMERTKTGEKYLLYKKDNSLVLTEIIDKEIVSLFAQADDRIEKTIGDKNYVRLNQKVYEIHEPQPYKLGRVPAFMVGYNRDLYTKGQTYLNPFDAAIPYMKKSIKVNSEMDLTTALIAFPQMIRYAEPCKNVDCIEGTLRDSGEDCPVCGGSGVHIPTSVQDAITLKMPKEKENMIDLTKLVAYVHPPVEVVKWQDEYIEKLTQRCYKTIYGSEAILKANITTTATEKTLDIEKTYDALYPMAVKLSKSWVLAVKLCATITDLNNELVVSYSFGKDFKLKSKSDYLIERKEAKDSGAASDVLKEIDKEIMRLSFVDNPEGYNIYQIRESFNPFSGKSNEEILILINTNLTTRRNKVLYLHLGVIFDQIEMETPRFYRLAKKKQQEIINNKIDEIIAELDKETERTQSIPIGG